ncbi:protein FAM200C-like [Palaemon carinicauda]|uniref:protein FAM200C-like n=1 Tax=Palaemon carinicauda TaxID=392227 RepID=UPI0035B610E1
MLARIAELADEIAIFLREYQSDFAENFEDEILILSLSYLADIFGHLNVLNLSMQGMFANNIDCTEKVEAFKKKISLWKRRIQGGNVGSFPILDEKHGDKTIQPMLIENIVAHLSLLETTMAQYFPIDHSFPEWIQQPFLADMDDDDNLKEELIDLQPFSHNLLLARHNFDERMRNTQIHEFDIFSLTKTNIKPVECKEEFCFENSSVEERMSKINMSYPFEQEFGHR